MDNEKGNTFERYINNGKQRTWKNMWCYYVDPDDGVKKNGYVINMYEIEDKTQPYINEVYETRAVSIPEHYVDDPLNGLITHQAYTTTETLTRRVWPKIKVCTILKEDGKILYDLLTEHITVLAQDLTFKRNS